MKETKNKNISEIITFLNEGKVLVLPTDTVYGFVCDASNEKAVERIFEIKKRDKAQTLPVFVKDIEMAKSYAKIDSRQEKIIKKIWPGAVTYVLDGKMGLSPLVYKNSTIALRAPNYSLVQEVLEKLGKPLAQTSANISGKPATTKISDILEQFSDSDVIIINAGNLPENKLSTIIDLTDTNSKVIRK